MKSKRIEVLGFALAIGFSSSRLFACGPNFPNNLLDRGDNALLVAPVADFYRELERMQLAPKQFEAVPATNGFGEQNIAAEIADLRVALKKAGKPEADAEQIVARHLAERNKLQKFDDEFRKSNYLSPWKWSETAQENVPGKTSEPQPKFPAVAVVQGLPAEFGDYLDGTIIWHEPGVADKAICRQMWERLLNRPAAERRFKSVAAAFMLGKSWEKENPDKAIEYFKQTRDLAKHGFVDSTGLAAASLGLEARIYLERQKYGPAIELYLDQLASGDTTAANSLWFAAGHLAGVGDADTLNELAANTKAQKVITAYLVSRRWPESIDPGGESARKWLAAVEAANIRDVDSAEKLALAAYQAGEWEIAQRWIDRTPAAPAAQWLQAKLLLRAGKLDQAAALLAKISRSFPLDPLTAPRSYELSRRRYNLPLASPITNAPTRFVENLFMEINIDDEQITSGQQALGELGVLHLARREYTEALDALLRAGFWMDAAYVAERVLTADELKTYVDRNWPAVSDSKKAESSGEESDHGWHTDVRKEIRYLLARRLTRLARGKEARPYYPADRQPQLDALLKSLATGRDELLSALDRFNALSAAATITRTNGMELIGTEVEPDWHIYGGNYEFGVSAAWRTNGVLVAASEDELNRAVQNGVVPEKRFHYRYQAASLRVEAARQAWEAAKLMPDNSDETARVLCTAGSWFEDLNAKISGGFYNTILRRCRRTEIGAEVARSGQFPRLDANGRVMPRKLNGEDHPMPGKPYVIHAGDTIFHVAAIVSEEGQPVTVQDIVQANLGLKADKIRAGQIIVIPAPKDKPGEPPENPKSFDAGLINDVNSAPPSAGSTEYVVESGDSIAGIARKFGVRASAIEEANGGMLLNRLKVGQRILIPAPPQQ